MPFNLQTSEIVIDPEFASLLAPLSHSELSELERSLKLVGCREALKVWHLEGKWILLDGHNRYRICLEHGIPFRVEAVELESRELALLWIESNQLGRRNLPDDARAVIALSIMERRSRLERHERAIAAGKTGGRNHPKKVSFETAASSKLKPKEPKERTRAAVAKEAKISERKLRVVQALRKRAFKVLGDARANELLLQIRRGEISIAAAGRTLVRAEAEQELRAAACNREVLGRKGQQAEIGCGRLVGPFRCCTCVRGDAMELLMELPMWAVDGAVTDPPYGLRLAAWDSRVPYHLLGRFLQISDGPVVWFGAAPVMTEACTMFDPQPERVLIWAPKFTLANARSKGIAYRFHPIYVWRVPEEHDGPTWDVLDVATEAGNWWRHPCTKPVALMKLLCRLVPEGGLILDPFAGSGSTLVAARLTGRHFLGFEMEQNYCDIIQARLRGKPSQRLE